MVKVAIAGGSGEVAREVTDALIASGKHDIVLLSRKPITTLEDSTKATYVQVDYSDKHELTRALHEVETVLSFITPQTDPANAAQKCLIDAAVAAGVRRFAPSEWATSSFAHMNWYVGKAEIREYLEALNRDRKVLEYTLFQPGLFLNYLTHPYKSATHVNTFQTQFDLQNRRAIVPEGYTKAKMSFTEVRDVANIVVKAIEYNGEWPVVGGIKGCELSVAEIIQLAKEIRGDAFAVEELRTADLKAGIVKSSWLPKVDHPAIPSGQADALAEMFLAGITLGISVGALNVSDEWNRLFPDYVFVQPREFLLKAWQGKA